MSDLTPAEERAIRALERLARSWPKSLWLFAADGQLYVMRVGPDGERSYTVQGGVDPGSILDSISLPTDGGDW